MFLTQPQQDHQPQGGATRDPQIIGQTSRLRVEGCQICKIWQGPIFIANLKGAHKDIKIIL